MKVGSGLPRLLSGLHFDLVFNLILLKWKKDRLSFSQSEKHPIHQNPYIRPLLSWNIIVVSIVFDDGGGSNVVGSN